MHPKLGWLGPDGFQRCHGLAIRPDQQEIWSACGASVTIHDITESSYRELDRILLESNAYWITFSPDGRWAFAALSRAGGVAVIDAASRRVWARFSAGAGPKRNLAIDLDRVGGERPSAARY